MDEKRLNLTNEMAHRRKIFIGGLNWQTTSETLQEYFSQFGHIEECTIMKDMLTNRSRGFGFINFSDSSSVDRVLSSGPHTVDSKVVEAKVAFPRPKLGIIQPKESLMDFMRTQNTPQMITRTRKVFVGGLSASTTADDMREFFSTFGRVTDAILMIDKETQRHRGFGFVTFESEDIVDKVCSKSHYELNKKMVEVKRAQPKEVMDKQHSVSAGVSIPSQIVVGRGYPYQGYFYPGITSVLVHPSGGVTSFAGSDPPQVITGTTPPNFYEYLYSIAPGAMPATNGMTAAGLIQLPQRSDAGVQLQPFLQRVIQSPVPSIQSRSTVLALTDYAHTNDIIMNGFTSPIVPGAQSPVAGIANPMGVAYQGQILPSAFQNGLH